MKPQNLVAAGYGEHDPIAKNATPEGRRENRRIEIILLPDLSANDARREVEARYAGKAKVQSVARMSADDPPMDLRRPIAALMQAKKLAEQMGGIERARRALNALARLLG